MHLQNVVRQAHQGPFAAHFFQPAEEEPSHPAPHGQEYRTDLEASGPGAQATILITIVGDNSDPESPLIVGNAGNTGNFGGQGQPGGKGLSGKSPLIVHLRGRNKDEG